MRKIIQLILLAILSGCATTQNYELVLSSWVGRDEIELIRGWGPPRQTYESAGSKFLVYFSSRNVFLPGTSPTVTTTLVGNTAYTNSIGGSPNMNVGMTCQTTFESVHSRIVSWSWKGNDCKALTAEKVSEKIKSPEESSLL